MHSKQQLQNFCNTMRSTEEVEEHDAIGQGFLITNPVGPDFQTKNVSWASYFSGEATRNDTF